MKALAQEVVEKFSSKLKVLNIVVKELTGDMQLTRAEADRADILVTTVSGGVILFFNYCSSIKYWIEENSNSNIDVFLSFFLSHVLYYKCFLYYNNNNKYTA